MTQKELADATGLNRSYIGDVELGKRNIALKNISKLAQGLHVTLEVLFKGIA